MADEIPMTAVVDCGLLGADGAPAVILRPMDDDELELLRTTRAAHDERAAAPVTLTTEEKLVGALEALPPDRVVSASELLAMLRPATMAADAASVPASEEPTDA